LHPNAAVHHSKNCALMSQMGHTRSFDDVRLNVRFAQKRTSVDGPQNAIPVIAVIRGTGITEYLVAIARITPP